MNAFGVFLAVWFIGSIFAGLGIARVIAWADTAPIRPRSRLTSFAGID